MYPVMSKALHIVVLRLRYSPQNLTAAVCISVGRRHGCVEPYFQSAMPLVKLLSLVER